MAVAGPRRSGVDCVPHWHRAARAARRRERRSGPAVRVVAAARMHGATECAIMMCQWVKSPGYQAVFKLLSELHVIWKFLANNF